MNAAETHAAATELLVQIARLQDQLSVLVDDTSYDFEQAVLKIGDNVYGAADALDSWIISTGTDVNDLPNACLALEFRDEAAV